MPALIESGHIYIAQPPLYKVKRGSSESYLKDQRAFENFLIDGGLEGAVLILARWRAPLGARFACRSRGAVAVVSRMCWMALHQRYSRTVVEQAAIAGLLNSKLADDEEEAEQLATVVVERLPRCPRRPSAAGPGAGAPTAASFSSARFAA